MIRRNNKGSAIVMVIAVMAGVGIMAAIALWLSFRNFQMKQTDTGIKESFYSAEGVLEQIKAGFQENVSEAYKTAMTKYLVKPSAESGVPGTSAEDKAAAFKEDFRNELISSVVDNIYITNYNTAKLEKFVGAALVRATEPPYAKISSNGGSLGDIRKYDDRIVMEKLHIRYVDADEYVSEIVTDIVVKVPEINSVTTKAVMDVFEYPVIANEGLNIGNIGLVTITGSVYSGSAYTKNNVNAGSKDSLVIDGGKVRLDNWTLVAEGNVIVKNNGVLDTGSKEKFWTENIIVDGSRANLGSTTYVSDDLTLKGNTPVAVIGGSYRGYGSTADSGPGEASSSSAIIINGINSTLDIEKAKEVMLSGYAYLGTGSVAVPTGMTGKNVNVRMGESIAVKGNQIAYLMPAEWIGTEGNDSNSKSHFGKNPISYSEYQELIKDAAKYTLVNINVASRKTGKRLLDYGVSEDKKTENYSTVFAPSITGSSGEGLVYFYVNLPHGSSEVYFKDYYRADGTGELNRHNNFYTSAIKASSAVNIKTAGSYSLFEGDKLKIGESTGAAEQSIVKVYKDTYRALCTKLVTDLYKDVTEEELARDVFDNIIVDNTKFNSLLGSGTEKIIELSGKKAVITKSDYIYNSGSGDVRLIVSQGNVYIRSRFEGTVIAKGKIIVDAAAGAIEKENDGYIKRLLKEPLSESNYLYDIFRQGKALSEESGSAVSGILFEDGSVDFGKMIVYENWKKQ